MKWEKVKIKDVCIKIGSGATPKGGAAVYIDEGTSLIRSQNVYNLFFDYDGLTHITESAAEKLKGVSVCKGDTLLNITGDSVARTCVVPDDVLPARVNQHVAIIRPNMAKLDSKFLNYYLASPFMQATMLGVAVGKGTSRNALTKSMIEDFEITLPPINIQKRISLILATYDNLIENCRKQIALLEEAAQRLYKEWFVDFKFPGHENVPIVDGLPEGWKDGIIGEIGKFIRGKNILTTEAIEGVVPVIAGGLTPSCWHNQSNTKAPVITVSGSGANAGFTAIHNVEVWAADCSYLDSSMTDNIYFIYCFLKRNSELLRLKQRGAAQPHVYAKDLNATEIVIPSEGVLGKFNNVANTIFTQIGTLKGMISKLTTARDKLLPRLMSGEIEIKE